MSKLPKMRIASPSAAQRDRLARWLAEWQADLLLRDDESSDMVAVERSDVVSEAGEPLQAGQIRLLFPESKESQDRLRYVAVLQNPKEGRCLIAPFGRFAEPATPGEMKTDHNKFLLRVICLWNAREISETTAQRSWVADELSETELTDALSVRTALLSHDAPPEQLINRVGPSIAHPLDPRNDYVEEERLWMAQLANDNATGAPIQFPHKQRELRKAAEDRAKYEAKKKEPPERPQS